MEAAETSISAAEVDQLEIAILIAPTDADDGMAALNQSPHETVVVLGWRAHRGKQDDCR